MITDVPECKRKATNFQLAYTRQWKIILTMEGARLMEDSNSEMWPPHMEFPHPLMHHCGRTYDETWSQPSKAEKKQVWQSFLFPTIQ
jgi:hypothetical protein